MTSRWPVDRCWTTCSSPLDDCLTARAPRLLTCGQTPILTPPLDRSALAACVWASALLSTALSTRRPSTPGAASHLPQSPITTWMAPSASLPLQHQVRHCDWVGGWLRALLRLHRRRREGHRGAAGLIFQADLHSLSPRCTCVTCHLSLLVGRCLRTGCTASRARRLPRPCRRRSYVTSRRPPTPPPSAHHATRPPTNLLTLSSHPATPRLACSQAHLRSYPRHSLSTPLSKEFEPLACIFGGGDTYAAFSRTAPEPSSPSCPCAQLS